MTHTIHTWIEQTGNDASRLSWLNNIENIYTDSVAYTDSVTHASIFYTKAEVDAKYFDASNDGAGSGLICDTLDGKTAQQIIDAGTPPGVIAVWNGAVNMIPAGWALCNGGNGTPNLCDKLVLAAGTNAPGVYGGVTSVSVTGTVTIATYALTTTELPSHTHTYTDYSRDVVGGAPDVTSNGYGKSTHTSSMGGGSSTAHGHPGSTFTNGICNILPAYWAGCFIMKL